MNINYVLNLHINLGTGFCSIFRQTNKRTSRADVNFKSHVGVVKIPKQDIVFICVQYCWMYKCFRGFHTSNVHTPNRGRDTSQQQNYSKHCCRVGKQANIEVRESVMVCLYTRIQSEVRPFTKRFLMLYDNTSSFHKRGGGGVLYVFFSAECFLVYINEATAKVKLKLEDRGMSIIKCLII